MQRDDATDAHTWSARTVRPIIVLYVTAVFLGFMVLAWFVFHSTDAAQALAIAAVGSLVGLAPAVLSRVEYRLTDTGLEKRLDRPGQAREFEEVFAWTELRELSPTRSGFRFHKEVAAASALARLARRHLSAGHSGDLRVEEADRARVSALIGQHWPRKGQAAPPGP